MLFVPLFILDLLILPYLPRDYDIGQKTTRLLSMVNDYPLTIQCWSRQKGQTLCPGNRQRESVHS